MSQNNSFEIDCSQVLGGLILYIDFEIEDSNQVSQIEAHIEKCPPCLGEFEHERKVLEHMKGILGRVCEEQAPEELQAGIKAQAQEFSAQFAKSTQVITEYRRTSTTIIDDTNGGVTYEETHIEIQTTHEIGPDFPLS